ncbi:MAG: hypothetical protein QOE96_210 [Blastocatellia bacterium]|jgi:hypothetical protein|nr:hypothetical protein [Blastocatellia bacterium]
MTEETLEIHFIHPHTSKRLVADLSPNCTGTDALHALLSADGGDGPFLSQAGGQTYELSLERTGTAITPNMTFREAGVINRDIINIAPTVIGAGSVFRSGPGQT